MAPLASAVMTSSGASIQPEFRIFLITGTYIVSLSMIFSGGKKSLHYVNSTNWMMIVVVGCGGGRWSWG
jgi:hypothetical protein